ncbi:RING/U-box superfamily protein [Striga asiatica]|uniref:RING/U-box superfamily protein n=1 Tax=Striga asiatica TaxID=4170 RepID=A0A5A7PCQ6_STRAF|nr:RING/U-box superfamily protein [Striga asiatica]
MGFPVGYTDVFLPKLFVHLLTFLEFVRKFASAVLSFLGLGDADLELESVPAYPALDESGSDIRSVTAALIREALPVVRFSDLAEGAAESCAVCLYEFGGEDEIRRLANCRHIFHRSCLDRWVDHDQKTCPLCRTPIVPEGMEEAFNERLWAASGILDLYGEHSPVTVGWC